MIVLSPDALADIERLRAFLDQANPAAQARNPMIAACHTVSRRAIASEYRGQCL
jgi:plasmid stabilization system protein ParE